MASRIPAPAFEPTILAEGVSKVYRVYKGQGRGWAKSVVLPFWKQRFYESFVALRDIDLRIHRGDIVGILGRNGSGKSTLLRLLAGISLPTHGTIAVRGQVRCLLATGINFNERFTGRENIVYGSATMGIPIDVARGRMDEIIEFSELGDAIDKPTLFYSAGMLTKLAFAVAFQETPEILLLDEAMAAGDIFFQHKCDQRVNEIVSSGSTVVMATHSLAAIEQLCTRAILLEGGGIIAEGAPSAVADRYREMLANAEAARPAQLAERARAGADRLGPRRAAPDSVELVAARMCDETGSEQDSFGHGEPIQLRLRLRGTGNLPRLRFVLDLMSEDFGVRVANTGTEHLSAETGELAIFSVAELCGEQEVVMRVPSNPFGSGLYSWTLSVRPFDSAVSTYEYLHASRIAPFRSVSFPGHPLGRLRRMLTEPAVEFTLENVEGSSPGSDPGRTAIRNV
jgi:ABC-type polysaccharide/polyol phosphate transport system ATPase subunit